MANEPFNVFQSLRQAQGPENFQQGLAGLPPEAMQMLRQVPGAQNTPGELARGEFLGAISPEQFSQVMQALNRRQAVDNQVQAGNDEIQKAQVDQELEQEIESGKKAQKIKNAIKSIEDLRALAVGSQTSHR